MNMNEVRGKNRKRKDVCLRLLQDSEMYYNRRVTERFAVSFSGSRPGFPRQMKRHRVCGLIV